MSETYSSGFPLERAAVARHQAAEWLIRRKDREGWSDADQSNFDNWISRSPAHKLSYLRVEAAWSRADRLRALREAPPTRDRLKPILKFVAGGTALAAAIGVFALANSTPPDEKVYTTGTGGRETLTLRDGSQIELNTNTSLRIVSDAHSRTVWLDSGEAYFQVVHNPNVPFVVQAGRGRVTDIGTKFLVRRNNDSLRVSLIEGKAEFEGGYGRDEQKATLHPGDVLVATAHSLSLSQKPAQEISDTLGWRRGLIILRHTTLAEAAAEFNRYNVTKIVITDPKIAQLNVNGALPADDAHAFARSMKTFFNVAVEERPGKILLSR